ncbi:MAG: aldo/keto reductase [Acholeplasmataceae bacterium]|nr:aldo/keto reductase [Acholeplasmataceae bacterium]
MAKRIETKSKKPVNRLGFGSWQLGNTEFWGHMSQDEGVELVKKAIAEGVNFFDTAPGYASGMSESIIGMAIENHREDIFIATKYGHTADGETDFSVFSLREQIYSSLERLQTDYLDALILHNPPWDILEGHTNHIQELKKLKEEGLIRYFGVSIDTGEEMELVLEHLDLDIIEIIFNIFFQEPIAHFKKINEKNIDIIAKVPLDSGWLTGKYDEFSEFSGIRMRWDDETIERRAFLVSRLKSVITKSDLTKYAMSFIKSFDEISVVIPGIRTIEQLTDHLNYQDYELSDELKQVFIDIYESYIKDDPLPW